MNFKLRKKQAGMTYVELIVVLSIFSIVTGTVIFNYKNFQAKVDLKNLVSDIVLKFVNAQKKSTAGEIPFGKIIPTSPPLLEDWKPSYGIYFNTSPGSSDTGNQVFYYFTDLDQNKKFDEIFKCPFSECIEKFRLPNEKYLSDMYVQYYDGVMESVDGVGISLTFTRPDSIMTIKKANDQNALIGVDFLNFRVEDASGPYFTVRMYSSGRIEII